MPNISKRQLSEILKGAGLWFGPLWEYPQWLKVGQEVILFMSSSPQLMGSSSSGQISTQCHFIVNYPIHICSPWNSRFGLKNKCFLHTAFLPKMENELRCKTRFKKWNIPRCRLQPRWSNEMWEHIWATLTFSIDFAPAHFLKSFWHKNKKARFHTKHC